ncbi:MAG: secondary thiamine-phosphate synthase enzyme YjbQ, partial [Candidatus Omnitrophica bacterium]|nr:secondary thiamine-phosphate synthase enzyme YjbQ [Candidatus Omnitrophota bacterium]
VVSRTLKLSTRGHAEVVDITHDVAAALGELEIRDGIVNVSCVGSTGAVTTVEYEPGLCQDIKDILDKLIPAGHYHHDQAWGDGNGHSHLRASLIGPSLTLPFNNRKMILGTWQQIIFIDLDNKPRQRQIVLQFLGE